MTNDVQLPILDKEMQLGIYDERALNLTLSLALSLSNFIT